MHGNTQLEVEIIPAKTVKYLGLHLDTKLTWRGHITKKRKQMDLRYKELCWLLSTNNKLPLYKPSLHP
jgi:hypothetical protein